MFGTYIIYRARGLLESRRKQRNTTHRSYYRVHSSTYIVFRERQCTNKRTNVHSRRPTRRTHTHTHGSACTGCLRFRDKSGAANRLSGRRIGGKILAASHWRQATNTRTERGCCYCCCTHMANAKCFYMKNRASACRCVHICPDSSGTISYALLYVQATRASLRQNAGRNEKTNRDF